MNQAREIGYFAANPWAVNVYQGRRHLFSEWFESREQAELRFRSTFLQPDQSIHLMNYRGHGRWHELKRR